MTVDEMMREVIQYAMEEMRNRGIEDSAVALEQRNRFNDAQAIRSLKRDPSLKMSDWWASTPSEALSAAAGEK